MDTSYYPKAARVRNDSRHFWQIYLRRKDSRQTVCFPHLNIHIHTGLSLAVSHLWWHFTAGMMIEDDGWENLCVCLCVCVFTILGRTLKNSTDRATAVKKVLSSALSRTVKWSSICPSINISWPQITFKQRKYEQTAAGASNTPAGFLLRVLLVMGLIKRLITRGALNTQCCLEALFLGALPLNPFRGAVSYRCTFTCQKKIPPGKELLHLK